MTMRHIAAAWLLAALFGLAGRQLAAQVPGVLTGQVTDVHTARAIGGARVEIAGRPEATRSAADGSFTLRGLEPRSYTIRVRALGYALREADVEIVNGRATTVYVALTPSAAALAAVVVRAARDSQALSATTFDRQAIEASGRRDLGELLQTTPGVVVTQAGGPGAASHASIRGSGANEVLVLVDGVALNSPITGEADLSRVPLEGVEQVIVRTGAQSARYGDRALAGVIEIRTRRPAHDASLLLRSGAWGERNASLSLGDSRPVGTMRAGGSLTADYRTVGGDFPYDVPAVRGGGTARRVNSDVTSRQLLGGLSLDDETRSIALRASWQKLSRGLAGSIVQPSTTGREGQLREDVGLDAAWRHARLSWTATGGLTRERATFIDPAPPFGTTYDDTVTATALTASTQVAIGDDPLSAYLGGEARSTNIASTMLAPGAPHWQRLLGAFGGVRASRALDSAGTRASLDASARVDHSSLASGATLSPRVEASLSRGLVVASASLGAGYAPPSLGDQFFHEGVLVRPNPVLQPERTRGDLEGRLALRDAHVGPLVVAGEAAAYRADIDGMILWQPDFRFIWSPSNYDVHRSGWELSGRGTLPAAWGLALQATLGHADVVYAGAVLDGQVAYRPRTTASVAIGAGPRIARVELTNQYVGARRTVPGSALNMLEPYWRTDARLTSSRPWRSWRVDATVGVENLLDRPAAMLVDYPYPSRSWTLALRLRRADGPAAP